MKTSTDAKPQLMERERRFVEFFMGEAAGNATKAARLAGYAKNTAEHQAARLLRKVGIRAAIEARASNDPAVATREERQRFWTAVLRGTGAFARTTMKDRLRASELLGRSQADFVERHQLEAGKTLVDVLASMANAAETDR
jgi:phage terminase small subunit